MPFGGIDAREEGCPACPAGWAPSDSAGTVARPNSPFMCSRRVIAFPPVSEPSGFYVASWLTLSDYTAKRGFTMFKITFAFMSVVLLVSCAATPGVPPAVRSDLAPTGTLRAAINYGNAVLA